MVQRAHVTNHDKSAREAVGTSSSEVSQTYLKEMLGVQTIPSCSCAQSSPSTPTEREIRRRHALQCDWSGFRRSSEVPPETEEGTKGLRGTLLLQPNPWSIPGTVSELGDRGVYQEPETTDSEKRKAIKSISDNGKTFVAAAKWLSKVRKDEKFNDFLAKQSITSQFNLSRAPWWGRQFERLIGLMKAAFYKTVGQGLLTWEELNE